MGSESRERAFTACTGACQTDLHGTSRGGSLACVALARQHLGKAAGQESVEAHRSMRTLKSISLCVNLAARLICQSVNSPGERQTKAPSAPRVVAPARVPRTDAPCEGPLLRTSAGMLSSSRHMSHQLLLIGRGTRHEWYATLIQKWSSSQLLGVMRSTSAGALEREIPPCLCTAGQRVRGERKAHP